MPVPEPDGRPSGFTLPRRGGVHTSFPTMWTVLLAMVVAGPGGAARPLAPPGAELRAAVRHPAVRTATVVPRKVEPQEGALARMLAGVELNGPVVLKPEFQGGPGAAIALKF